MRLSSHLLFNFIQRLNFINAMRDEQQRKKKEKTLFTGKLTQPSQLNFYDE
jgi:hypothetical protein